NDPRPASVYTLPLHDALPISDSETMEEVVTTGSYIRRAANDGTVPVSVIGEDAMEVRAALLPVDLLTSLPSVVNLPENETRLGRSEEHTSELQSRENLVCRLL